MEFNIQSMSCGGCVNGVTRTVKQLDPQAEVQVDLASKKVTVQTTQDRQTLAAALTEAGYPTD